MDIGGIPIKSVEDPVHAESTSGFLKNNGVDTKHDVMLMARVRVNGNIERYSITKKLEVDYGVPFALPKDAKILEYWFSWRDDAGRIRYSTELRTAPPRRYFISVGGWWMTDPDEHKAQSFVPSFTLV